MTGSNKNNTFSIGRPSFTLIMPFKVAPKPSSLSLAGLTPFENKVVISLKIADMVKIIGVSSETSVSPVGGRRQALRGLRVTCVA
jgi:hypothetical protein